MEVSGNKPSATMAYNIKSLNLGSIIFIFNFPNFLEGVVFMRKKFLLAGFRFCNCGDVVCDVSPGFTGNSAICQEV